MKYQICTKTVMDTSDPSIVFDKDVDIKPLLEISIRNKKTLAKKWRSLFG